MGTPRVINGSEEQAQQQSTTAPSPVGTKLVVEDGRTFRMSQCDTSSALVGQVLAQSQVPSGNYKDEDCAAIAAGEKVITEVGATGAGAAKNWFENGYVVVTEAAQLDPIHRIDRNKFTLTGSDVGDFELASELIDAIGDAETITYILNPYKQIIVHPSPPTALMTGVTVRAMAVDVYGWVATTGPARCLQDGALVVGGGVSPSATVNGAVFAWDSEDASNVNAMYVGSALITNSTTTAPAIVFLRLDAN